MSTIPVLPYELLDIIFDDIRIIALAETTVEAKKDLVKGVRSCLFASRAFRRQALRLLFQHVHIKSKPLYTFKARIARLCDALDPDPSLELESAASFIQSVTISFEPERSEETLLYIIRPQEVYISQLQRFLANKNLTHFLRQVTGIREFEITLLNPRASYRPSELNWEDLSNDFREALFACIHSSNLRYFGVSGILRLPESLFESLALVYLRQVHSVPRQLLPYLGPEQTEEMPVPTTEVIFAVQCQEQLSSPYQLLDELESLSSSAEQFKATTKIMDMGKGSLINIWLEHYGETPMAPLLKLDEFKVLKSFCYSHRCIPFFTPENANQSLDKVHQLIDIRFPMDYLENMDLDFYCQSEEIPEPWLKPSISANWERLSKILSGPNYPSLKTLKLSIFIEVMGELMGDFDPKQFIELHHVQLQRAFQDLLMSKRTKLTIDLDLSIEALAI